MFRRFITCALLTCASFAYSYPEFQKFAQEQSGRRVDCAMCHIAATGPSGSGLGQISGLSAAEKELLQAARDARQPGQDVKSPILNAFGNNMVKVLGGEKIVEVTTEPVKLAALYGFKSDIDEDGIADAREYLDGTDPTSNQSGRPLALFTHNLKRSWLTLLVSGVSVVLILFGFRSLLKYYLLRQGLR